MGNRITIGIDAARFEFADSSWEGGVLLGGRALSE